MKLWAAAFGLVGLAGAVMPPAPPGWTLVVSGDADGYLSPCGCTYPMSGGVRRRATAIRTIQKGPQVVVLDAGGLGGEPGRQGEMKAETAAQISASLHVTAMHLTERDVALGAGSVSSVARLAEDRLVSTSVSEGTIEGVAEFREAGPFLIGGASEGTASFERLTAMPARSPVEAARRLAAFAAAKKKTAVLMYSGGRDAARKLAQAVSGLAAIVYRSGGDPPTKIEREGTTVLLTPGERGKHIVRAQFGSGVWNGYASVKLDPHFEDDPAAARIYGAYLKRVDRANLLDEMPRRPSDPFAGNQACGSCHQEALKVWKASKHAMGLQTLETEGHGRDPDCVSCHVVGLDREGGFRSRAATPQLAEVGCESCHGPGGRHAGDPLVVKMAKVGKVSCAPCHRSEQSPNFDFLTYWQKISH